MILHLARHPSGLTRHLHGNPVSFTWRDMRFLVGRALRARPTKKRTLKSLGNEAPPEVPGEYFVNLDWVADKV